MSFEVMDITDMSAFESNQFDLAVDKSTIDALLCGDDSFIKVAQMLKETQRVLKPGGIYFAISYGKPESRSFHFQQPFLGFENREFILYDANIDSEEEREEKSHYIYVCKKLQNADDLAAQYFEECIEQYRQNEEAAKDLDDRSSEEADEEPGQDLTTQSKLKTGAPTVAQSSHRSQTEEEVKRETEGESDLVSAERLLPSQMLLNSTVPEEPSIEAQQKSSEQSSAI